MISVFTAGEVADHTDGVQPLNLIARICIA